ncbi:hypothetical protein ONE63_006036 [Megalurothrips usitatus]|uniref:Uncharacterized protein n=1 Tax=Megalurothrips usitatus TaxID=439358 RepID=A0AAV7XS38_9NEOP|nr:hypothetical protein ONE63_006036 [Megalurothrips usitatus]
MNPGYAGRTELPDNLKALFRPVAMMVPNYTLIAEISLFSFGFSDARQLANKITTTFKLSSEQLSSQDHYDFGMRAVKTVIAVAGNLKREKPDMGEPQIVLRAIRDVNVPKFLRDDLKLFNGIVSDLFPRLQEEQVDYGALLEAVRRVCLQKGLEDVSEFMQKVVQLYDTTVVRHGLMLVGPTGSGKTKCYEVLRDAVTQLSGQQSPSGSPFTPVRTHVINPKAITLGQLYGEFDAVTHEWTDGILPSLVRGGAAAADADKRWYVFDGPVDAVWIENLNTVLDDNKKLCLTSGEIIKLSEHMTMVFEVADLAVASPATVSRCGMVYLDPSVLGLSPFLECWLRNLPPAGREAHPRLEQDLRALLTTFLLGGVSALRGASQGAELVEILASVDVCLVQGCLRLLDARLAPLRGPRPPPAAPFMALLPDLLAPWVALAVVWSVGATCDGASRPMFSQWLRAAMAQHGAGPAFPDEGLVYDYRLHDGGFQDPTDNGEPAAPRWLHWMHGGAPYVIPEHARYSDIEVPTVDTVRSAALLELLVTRGHNVACVGPTGTGKTLTVTAKLGRGLPEKFVADFLCFSARTSAGQTQDVIDAKLDRRRKGVFGPPPTKRQLLFIDDFNMPAPEEYGAQPPIELIRQWLDFQGWYDRKAVGDFHQIVDVNLVVAMGPAGGGRSAVTPRALRHFHCLAFNELEPHSKAAIFGTVARWWLSRTERLLPELDRLVSATLDVYDVVLRELLPTPTKTHYTFNLRDLSKVFQGMLMANPKAVVSLEQLLVLWYHENLRVYQDRLVSDKDRSWFGERLRSVLRGRFNQDHIGEETLYFGDVCSPEREYVRITDVDKLSAALRELLDDYNSQSTAPMRLVLFTDAVQHVCRIARVLRQPQGNALLLGMGGSGRQSLTRLAAFASELTCFRVELSRAYGPAEWRADVKQLLLKAGLHMKEVVFLFSDTQIKSESFLEDLNNVLSSGDVPNIYEAEELDKIYQLMRGVVTDQGLQATRSNMFSAFQRLIKSNLHCIITMSPIGDVFRARLRMFPALVNCCTIDWFSAWPDHALQSVATRFLGDIPGMEVAAVRAGVVAVCQVMHSSAAAASERFQRELSRHFYVTPTSYLELLTSYADLLAKKRAELDQGIRRLRGGLHKLQSTAEEVAVLQQDLTAMRPALARAQGEAAAMLNKIAADTVRAERARHEVEKEESAATEKSGVCAAIAADAEADLAEALPALLDAERSLKALNKNDISEVRALKKPPGGVVLVIEAICIAMGVAPNRVPGPKIGEKVNDFWTPGMTLLASPDQFLSSLVNYDKENMAEDTIRKLRPYIENPNFQPRSVVKVSKACGSLCVWTHAVFRFYFVYQVVKPKKEKLAEANKELEATQQALQATRGKMAKILAGLEALREELRRTEVEMAELEARAQLCEDRLDRARRLLGGVASERGRWAATVEALESGKKLLIGDILVSAGAVAYLTAFTDRYRRELLRRWVSALSAAAVPHSEACSPVSTLADPVSVRLWQVDGLPRDALSTENAVLVAYSHRWPLFIDPQGQANRWIRNTFKDKTLTVLRLSDGHLMRSLETAIRYGFPALLESVGEELDPALDPVLARATFQQGQAGLVIKLGDALVPYHSDFRLYITTKLPNPHYLPELAIKVLLVNFALVPGGLTDQLLGLVVMEERPDLEEARSAIITSTAQMKLELKEIEDRTLELLSASDGSPVDDIDLILSLEASKQKSEEILAKVEASEETKREIEATRVGYLPVANRAQILYFCLYDLSRLDPMYQYSLEWFTAIFVASVRGSPKEDSLERRIRAVNDAFTFSLYGNVCRSLFERHKLWFGVLLCARILLDLGRIHPAEWHFFLAAGTPDAAEANPAPNWLSARAWAELLAMRKLERLREFAEAVPRNIAHYKAMFDSPLPHREKLPEPWEGRLDGFQRLLLLRALRPDKLAEGLQDWLTRGLGARFVEPQATDLATMFADASPTIPLVFVLSTGTDPAQELFQFADKMRMSKRLGVISLGQGQGPRAERLLLQAAEEGSWVFFQNCHLAPSWMPRLEQLLEGITDDTAHRDFRIWLTSTPSPAFPVSILQASSKMTVEPPRGVKVQA